MALDRIPELVVARELRCRSCPGDYKAATYITTKVFARPWPLCDEHATLALIAGAAPVPLESEEGRREAAKLP